MKVFNASKIIKYKKQIFLGVGILACSGMALNISGILSNPPTAIVSSMITSISGKQLPIYCVNTEEKKVSISFDAAWGADDTDTLLRILEENDVKTTFFLCGYWVDEYPEEVQKIVASGHDLGNHSSTHPHMSQLSSEQITKELQDCHNAVKDLTGIDMNLFRPPFGEYDNNVIETTYANDYYPVQWDVERID